MISIKYLITNYKQKHGRNNFGKITSKFKGGGLKKKYRKLIFNYSNFKNFNIYALWIKNCYDPYRKAYIILIKYLKGYKIGYHDYILAPENLKINDLIYFNLILEQKIGTIKKLKYWIVTNYICNIEFKPNQGSQLTRSAGTFSLILALDKKYALLKLPSKEQRLISNNCFVMLGKINIGYLKTKVCLKKAGKKRNLNRRPKVRGVAKNAYDHPYGGGEGRSRIGKKNVYSSWGKIKFKTSANRSFKFILLRKKN
uniref:50S ribosomal protein L2 n=1 Tax=Nephromyces sp. ex Molgula occidentalis TaxID=2544991 RepID=A0A5C1H8I1_9APIC|nr:50S ribosomal protein L2 [Nephromyces sp. ex Molgula occidentalis]